MRRFWNLRVDLVFDVIQPKTVLKKLNFLTDNLKFGSNLYLKLLFVKNMVFLTGFLKTGFRFGKQYKYLTNICMHLLPVFTKKKIIFANQSRSVFLKKSVWFF